MTEVRRLAGRSQPLRRDLGLGEAMDDDARLRRLLEGNPIAAFLRGRGMGGITYFTYEAGRLFTTFQVPADQRAAFAELARETVDWRLGEYLQRPSASAGEYLCNVGQANGRPMLFLPDRGGNPGLPRDWTDVMIDGELHQANFVKVAFNVARGPGSTKNTLPEILRRWFGDEAGQPGRHHRVLLSREGGVWALRPAIIE